MKIYLLSLGAGLLVGVIYSLINVRSPAPPVVALIGLLGILVGEQIVPLAKTLWNREPTSQSWLHHHVSCMFSARCRRAVSPTTGHMCDADPPQFPSARPLPS